MNNQDLQFDEKDFIPNKALVDQQQIVEYLKQSEKLLEDLKLTKDQEATFLEELEKMFEEL